MPSTRVNCEWQVERGPLRKPAHHESVGTGFPQASSEAQRGGDIGCGAADEG